ncbi:MAG: nitrate reductase associated protein [Cyanobacteria bacterium P01_H01_bin.58]
MSDLNSFFQFETDFVESLRCIPMQVRYKLDTCGIKLKLEHWHRFTAAERTALVTEPCETEAEIANYGDRLQTLVIQQTEAPAKELPIDPHPPWLQTETVPATVQAQAHTFDINISIEAWQQLTSLQRFALCKLSRPSHENRNFLPALREFGLTDNF